MRTNLLDEVGERDGWRCWICDDAVDPEMSVNDPRGPSVDSLTAKPKQAKGPERLAHRGCNSRKGAVAVEIPWRPDLFVVDAAPLLAVADRLRRKGGREVVARCPGAADAEAAAAWLSDRLSRLTPDLRVTTHVSSGGGQYLVALVAAR